MLHLFRGGVRRDAQRQGTQERRAGSLALLEEWTERAKASEIAELKAFTVKLLQDTEAVVVAMILPYSQGQTEGRVNKLKLVKRSRCTGGVSSIF